MRTLHAVSIHDASTRRSAAAWLVAMAVAATAGTAAATPPPQDPEPRPPAETLADVRTDPSKLIWSGAA